MATYDWLFNVLGLRKWCDAARQTAPCPWHNCLQKPEMPLLSLA